MRRTSIEIDDERLAEVQNILGTTGLKDTIDRAFDEVLRAELRRRLAERIASGDGIDRDQATLEASKRW
ncbi:MAG: type II toxin-antitoxin system VapB family antitoxin [Acidimicrobiia bacterium]